MEFMSADQPGDYFAASREESTEGGVAEYGQKYTTQWHMPMQQSNSFFSKKSPEVTVGATAARTLEVATSKDSWWNRLDRNVIAAANIFEKYNFIHERPTEQFIIGNEITGVRFYNYGEPLNERQVEECHEFTDVAAAYFGMERVQAMATDVVFTPLKTATNKPRNLGYRNAKLYPNVFFIDDTKSEYEARVPMLHVMFHEFGHLFEEDTPGAQAALRVFAAKVGWGDAPPPIATPDTIGVPTVYAQESPSESLAESVAWLLDGTITQYPKLERALYEYFDAIDVAVDRNPIPGAVTRSEHRTGDTILYPL